MATVFEIGILVTLTTVAVIAGVYQDDWSYLFYLFLTGIAVRNLKRRKE